MKDKHNSYDYNMDQVSSEQTFNPTKLNKYDFDLFDDSKAKPAPVVRIKRLNSSTKGERWRVMENDEVKFVLEGNKLSKKEREFIRTLDGVNWLIAEYKVGFKSFNELKGRLKQKLV